MKKAMALAMALLLLFGCVSVHAETADGLTEVRCDEWHFSVKLPSGMKAVPYDYQDPEDDERTIGGGLAISPEGTDGLPRLWILRRDHAFNNPYYYLTGFWWDDLSNSDMLYEDTGYALSEHGGITLRESGCRFFGDDDQEVYREYRFTGNTGSSRTGTTGGPSSSSVSPRSRRKPPLPCSIPLCGITCRTGNRSRQKQSSSLFRRNRICKAAPSGYLLRIWISWKQMATVPPCSIRRTASGRRTSAP